MPTKEQHKIPLDTVSTEQSISEGQQADNPTGQSAATLEVLVNKDITLPSTILRKAYFKRD